MAKWTRSSEASAIEADEDKLDVRVRWDDANKCHLVTVALTPTESYSYREDLLEQEGGLTAKEVAEYMRISKKLNGKAFADKGYSKK